MTSSHGHILVVDDDQLTLNTLSRNLEPQGYTVALAEDGQQALEMIQAQSFDLMLLDILMPEIDGYQVLERMKSDGTLRDLPVIVISAVDEMESVIRCISMGAEDYLTKPFNSVLLKARIGACLEKKQLRDQEQAYLKQLQIERERLVLLNRMGRELTATLDLPQVIERLLQAVIEIVGAEGSSVWLWDKVEEGSLVCRAAFHHGQERTPRNLRREDNLPPPQFLNRAVDASLSGGERKRVELASVLAMKPKLAILDEVDSGIDVLSLPHLINGIVKMKSLGSSVLLITHNKDAVEIADKASLICAGKILKTGPSKEMWQWFKKNCQICNHTNVPE